MKRKILWITGTISILSIFAFVILLKGISQRSTTEWYTSPSLDAKGTRVKVLIPVGWKVEPIKRTKIEYSIHVSSSSEHSFTLPFGIRIPWQRDDYYGGITVIGKPPLQKPLSPFDDLDDNHWAYIAVGTPSPPVPRFMIKSRKMQVKPDNYSLKLDYIDNDQARFERLNRAIAGSLTVLQ